MSLITACIDGVRELVGLEKECRKVLTPGTVTEWPCVKKNMQVDGLSVPLLDQSM